jgi:hypothetical protein
MQTNVLRTMVAAGAACFTLAAPISSGYAVEQVYTPFVYWGDFDVPDHGTVPLYLQAAVSGLDTWVDIRGAIISGTSDPNVAGIPLPKSFLRVNAVGYIDGTYCGETGWQYNADNSPDAWNVSNSPCLRLPGTHAYTSVVTGGVWNGNDYTEFGTQSSPVLSY